MVRSVGVVVSCEIWKILRSGGVVYILSLDLVKLDREVRVCRMLRHDNIVRLHCVFKEESSQFMVFDL